MRRGYLSAGRRCGSVARSLVRLTASLASIWALGAGCAQSSHETVRAVATDGAAWRAMLERCEPGDPVRCPADVYRAGMAACIDDWEAARTGEIELRRCRELAGVDQSELRGTIDILRGTIDRLREQRWWWGVVGVAVGALIVTTITVSAK